MLEEPNVLNRKIPTVCRNRMLASCESEPESVERRTAWREIEAACAKNVTAFDKFETLPHKVKLHRVNYGFVPHKIETMWCEIGTAWEINEIMSDINQNMSDINRKMCLVFQRVCNTLIFTSL